MGKLLLYALVSFNNYVDQILPIFDPPPSVQKWIFYLHLPFVSTLEYPLVRVIVEWPLNKHESEPKKYHDIAGQNKEV